MLLLSYYYYTITMLLLYYCYASAVCVTLTFQDVYYFTSNFYYCYILFVDHPRVLLITKEEVWYSDVVYRVYICTDSWWYTKCRKYVL